MTVTSLAPPDPIFALAPELRLHWSKLDGKLVVNSREVARVYFRRNHRRVLRKIMEDIWDEPMQPDAERDFRPCADGSVDITSSGLPTVLSHWGFGLRNKRVNQFNHDMTKLMFPAAKQIEAKTGTNPITEAIKRLFPGVRSLYLTKDRRRCCDDCRTPESAGPMLHDELWATIAEPHTFLCFDCTEKRLGRPLTQRDLPAAPFNAGWVDFAGADVAALQFARGRRLLPP